MISKERSDALWAGRLGAPAERAMHLTRRLFMSFFERHRLLTGLVLLVIFAGFLGLGAELFLSRVYGLGSPVIYENSPLYGYRPVPDRDYTRFNGASISFNNLGLRAAANWDDTTDDKILFLGDSVTYGGSYISNDQLFSSVAGNHLPGYAVGNGGVNAWGVLNVTGLVLDAGFQPADTYVLVFPEGDFYRGLTRMAGMPFFNRPPASAMSELMLYVSYRLNNRRYTTFSSSASDEQLAQAADVACRDLVLLRDRLAAQGMDLHVFITPKKQQVYQDAPRDSIVAGALNSHGIQATYLLDMLRRRAEQEPLPKGLFQDNIHLTAEGHALWGELLGMELADRISQ